MKSSRTTGNTTLRHNTTIDFMIHSTNCYILIPNICIDLGIRKTKMTKASFLTSKSV